MGIELDIVVMAAGRGTRMKSALPKVLHRLAGRSLLQHVLHTAAQLGAKRIVTVTGHGAEQVEAAARHAAVAAGEASSALCFVRQTPQRGTGHAVQQAAPLLGDDDPEDDPSDDPRDGDDDAAAGVTLILNGDTPLIEASTARALVDACGGQRLALLTIALDDPSGYGRIVRRPGEGDGDGRDAAARSASAGTPGSGSAAGDIRAIVEHRDASVDERQIREVYTGVMAAPTARLKRWLAQLTDDNAQREFYLTDVVAFAVADGVPVVAAQPASELEVLGVNSPAQLAALERRWQRQRAGTLMEAGVRLADPARIDVRFDGDATTAGAAATPSAAEDSDDDGVADPALLRCGRDVSIDVGCIFEGAVELADNVSIGAYCVIRNARIGAGAVIHPFTHIDGDALGVTVGADARVGPYARLRPGAALGDEVHVGNFVEVKNATLARGAKANHLAYLGDATVGERVNFGAGSITANYDGVNKHRTLIGDDAHVGSNCVLVAPVMVGAGATIGGGSTIGRDAPAGQLTVARARQVSLAGWKRPKK